MFWSKKPNKEELGELPLDTRGRKEGLALLKGVKKFLRYNDDLIGDGKKEEIAEKREAFATTLENPGAKRKELEVLAEELTDTCKKSVKDYKPSALKENIEVIFVAVVIAMGIRAYFIQQFKIPTGSMQPTLNGIVSYPTKEMNPKAERNAPDDYSKPGFPQLLWDKFWYGRSHVDWVVEEDDVVLLDSEHFYGKTHFIFFPRTYLKTKKGQVFSAPGTQSRVFNLLNTELLPNPQYVKVAEVKKGQTIAKGFVDTGDQLVVNKFAYHWVKPKRSDVFVFNTQNIGMIQRRLDDPRQGSQHYIKRLIGIPGDTVEVDQPNIRINGEIPTEPGFQRVMSQEGYYTGYTNQGTRKIELPPRKYWAMGDNSANSLDSRAWGTVPEENIVGRAAFVYYPFGHHFGKIE
ncbi:signal peptidase I [Verrucomicrobiales bacterium BCK34]|nr:signal peptidase I [Verrucomicrobiales bacterium BCK34]